MNNTKELKEEIKELKKENMELRNQVLTLIKIAANKYNNPIPDPWPDNPYTHPTVTYETTTDNKSS